MNERVATFKLTIFRQTSIVGLYDMNDNATRSEEDHFFSTLSEKLDSLKDREDLVIIGDSNSNVGNANTDIEGPFWKNEIKNDGNKLKLAI